MLRFDHIAIGCATLEQGAAYLADKTGLTVPVGGEHPLMGTHNLVMSLGVDTFFEVISINPSAPKPSHPRWFGLDGATFAAPRPHSWILNTDDLDEDLAEWRDVLAREPERGEELEKRLIDWMKARDPGFREDDLTVRKEIREKLKALGYY